MRSFYEQLLVSLILSVLLFLLIGADYWFSAQGSALVPSVPVVKHDQKATAHTEDLLAFLNSTDFDQEKAAFWIDQKNYHPNLHTFHSLCKSVSRANAMIRGEELSAEERKILLAKFEVIEQASEQTYAFLNSAQRRVISQYAIVLRGLGQYGQAGFKEYLKTLSTEQQAATEQFLNTLNKP